MFQMPAIKLDSCLREVQTLTYPFEGNGERRWIVATVALLEAKSAKSLTKVWNLNSAFL